jgi:hypothetical protein
MIRYLFTHLFYPKKMMMILISLSIITLFLGLLTFNDQSISQQLLYQDYLNLYYHQMMSKTIKLVMPFLVVLCVMDHDQAYLKPLLSYSGRSKVIISKLILYPFILFFIYSFIWMVYHLLPSLLTSYYVLNDLNIHFFIHIYLDGLIISLLTLSLIKDKYKAFSILFSLFYLLFSFIQEDLSLYLLYLVFPFENQLFDAYSLAYPYKICYITLGFTLSHRKLVKETLK